MSATAKPLSGGPLLPPTTHQNLVTWVQSVAELARPASIEWCDRSEKEWIRLTRLLVRSGTLTPLNPAKRPNSFRAVTDPSDMARLRR